MRIALTQNKFALVDNEDFDWLSQWSWTYDAKNNYAFRGENKGGRYKCIKMHRVILAVPRGLEIDHINRNGIDNRKVNLRTCNDAQNAQNRSKQKTIRGKLCSSNFKGVSFQGDCKKWKAQIRKDGKLFYLGLYDTEEDAAKKYNLIASDKFGEFANLNVL